MPYEVKNLANGDGGALGFAYVLAMGEPAKCGISDPIERVGETSVGANAVLVGLNYSVDETRDVPWKLDSNNFLDDSWGIVRGT